jgi:hypothetical protein
MCVMRGEGSSIENLLRSVAILVGGARRVSISCKSAVCIVIMEETNFTLIGWLWWVCDLGF